MQRTALPASLPFDMVINDSTTAQFTFDSTGGWQTYQTKIVDVQIPDGASVKFKSDTNGSYVVLNLDYIEYTPI